MAKVSHNPSRKISRSDFTTILKLYLAEISENKVKIIGTPDDR